MKPCAFDGCPGAASPKAGFGLCGLHYGQKRRGKPLSPVPYRALSNAGKLCEFEGCQRAMQAKGLCEAHYQQRANGRPMRPVGPPKKQRPPGPCKVAGCDREHASRLGYCTLHYHVLQHYRLTPERYEEMAREQGDVCAICRERCATGRRLAVDHDHVTGEVRGLLCARCNRAVGLLRDSPDVLEAAADYLRRATRRTAA